MRKIRKILDLDRKIVGINARNRIFVYPNNKRKDFIFANDKAITKTFLRKHKIPHPKTYALIEKVGNIMELWKSISHHEELVIKPAKGRGGGGILVLTKADNSSWKTPSGRTFGEKKIISEIANIIFGIHSFGGKDRVIIEQLIKSHNFFSEIYPIGVPDVRMITYKRKTIGCMLRIPTDKSDGKANLHQGAIGVAVDMQTGIMQKAYNYKAYLSHHPDTGRRVEGLQIPYWQEIREMTDKISEHSPLLFLGIDIAIDNDLGPLVLEINARPGIEIQNVAQKGLLDSLKDYNF